MAEYILKCRVIFPYNIFKVYRNNFIKLEKKMIEEALR